MMSWINYKKADEVIPHSWISECLKIFSITDKVRDFISYTMNKGKVDLDSGDTTLG